eukprot:351359-Pyramimonas_sp.AAC.1
MRVYGFRNVAALMQDPDGALFGSLGAVLEPSPGLLGRLGALWGRLGPSGQSWGPRGAVLGRSGTQVGLS